MAFSLLDTPAELRREPASLLYTDDFSRIQRFIYTVHTEGALRSLRSRSFFLELLMEHYMDELLDGCGLYVLCACEGNDQLKMLKELFPLLGLSGIGGRTSAGYGRLQRHQGDPSISARRLRRGWCICCCTRRRPLAKNVLWKRLRSTTITYSRRAAMPTS